MSTDQPESSEQAYRRGYTDGFIQALNYAFLDQDQDIPEKLFSFWQYQLIDWSQAAQDKEEAPPEYPG